MSLSSFLSLVNSSHWHLKHVVFVRWEVIVQDVTEDYEGNLANATVPSGVQFIQSRTFTCQEKESDILQRAFMLFFFKTLLKMSRHRTKKASSEDMYSAKHAPLPSDSLVTFPIVSFSNRNCLPQWSWLKYTVWRLLRRSTHNAAPHAIRTFTVSRRALWSALSTAN